MYVMPFSEEYNKLKSRVSQIVKSVKNSDFLSNKKVASLPYAYPCDNYIDSILSNVLVRKTLQLFSDKYCKEQIENIKSTVQLVTAGSSPRFFCILQECYEALNVEELPEVYITGQLKGINALSVGTDNAPVMLISRKAVITLSDGELKFMIGHELGHILQKNLMCHMIKGLLDNMNNKSKILGPIVTDLIDVPLNQWYRCAEFTADRAGLICAGSLMYVESLFARICGNTCHKATAIEEYWELSNMHPLFYSRIRQLEQFDLG